jgi:hypothetical protein
MSARRSLRSGCGPVNSKFSLIWVRADGPLTWTMWAWAWEGREAFQVRADRVSWVATMYQGGIVFQVGVPEVSVNASRLSVHGW